MTTREQERVELQRQIQIGLQAAIDHFGWDCTDLSAVVDKALTDLRCIANEYVDSEFKAGLLRDRPGVTVVLDLATHRVHVRVGDSPPWRRKAAPVVPIR